MTKQIPPAPARTGRHPVSPTLGLLPTIALSTAMAMPGHAQTADDATLGTIYLDSQGYLKTENTNSKATATVANTPQTIQTITSEEIKARGLTSVEEVLRTTPGVTLQAAEGGNPYGISPNIRGFDSNADITVDGIRNSSRTQYEAFNLESIQVTKGASGSTTGRGGTGGTINLDTKGARLGDNFVDTSLTYGTGNLLRGTLDWNKQVSDRVALRFNLMAQSADDLQGRKNRSSDRKGIAAALSYAMTDATTLNAGLYYHKNNDMPDYGIPYADDKPLAVDNSTWYCINNRDFMNVETRSAYVRLDHEFTNSLCFSATLRQTSDSNAYLVTAPRAGGFCAVTLADDEACPDASYYPDWIRANTKSSDRKTKTLAFNAQLSGEANTGALKHSFAVGVDLSRERTYRGSVTSEGPSVGLHPTNPDNGQPWPGTVSLGERTLYGKTNVKSIYAFDTIELSPKFQLNAGLRYDMFDSTTTVGRRDAAAEGTESSKFWNGNIGVVYHPVDNLSLYASVASSAEPALGNAGIQTDARSVDALNLKPERSFTYEIGAKWLPNPDLMLGAAIYQIEKKNERTQDAEGNWGLAADRSSSRGFELTFAGQVSEKLNLSGGYTYIDYSADGGETNYVRSVPRHAFSIWSTYDLNDKWTLGAGAFYTGTAQNSSTLTLPASWQIDAMAQYKFNNGFAAQVNVTNLLDEDIYKSARSGFINMGPARTISLTINKSF